MRSKLYVIHNTTDKVARGEVSLHLDAFTCPSPIKERKWGWIWRVSPGRVPPSKATLSWGFSRIYIKKIQWNIKIILSSLSMAILEI